MKLFKHMYLILIFYIGFGCNISCGAADIGEAISKTEDIWKITYAGDNFRKHMQLSYSDAVGMYASPEVASWFKKIDETWWGEVPPGMVWRRLLIDSQMLITNTDSSPLIFYYSVWPDVYFITEWQIIQGVPKIMDADIVSGDWFRTSRQDEIQSTPYWSRSNSHLLNAIMEAVTLSLKKTDTLYVENTKIGWRELGGLDDTVSDKRLESSRAIARTNILSNLSNVFTFQTHESTTLGEIRPAVYQMLASLYLGEIEEYLFEQKLKVGSDVEKYLHSINERAIVSGSIVAHVEDADSASVFIAFPETPHVVLSLRFGRLHDLYRVEQIEAANYAEAYLNAE